MRMVSKLNKKEIISGIQFFLIMYSMVMGFYFTYASIWYKIGLPVKWWTLFGATLLALASVFGVCQWIQKSER